MPFDLDQQLMVFAVRTPTEKLDGFDQGTWRDAIRTGPVGVALIGMGWWGQKILNVLQAAPADIRVVRAVEPNIETVRSLCAETGVPLSADYADALA